MSADERRAEIVEAAVRAFASSGLHGTSTEEIARLAGVSQPYLFRLFGTKRGLFIAALDRMFGRLEYELNDAADKPVVVGVPDDLSPVLASIARRYGKLLEDQSLLRLQLHGFAACDDPEIRAFVSRRFSDLIALVSERSGVPGSQFASSSPRDADECRGRDAARRLGPRLDQICEGGAGST